MTEPTPFATGRGGLVVVVTSERLRAACVAKGCSLRELASRGQVSRPTLRSARSGRPVRPRTAWKLARALNQAAPEPDLLEIMAAA